MSVGPAPDPPNGPRTLAALPDRPPEPRAPAALPRWVWIALIALAGAAACYRSDDPAYWFHLAAGRSIAQHGLPSQEIWCLAARGEKPWLSEWLFDVGLYRLHALGGDPGVALWRIGWAAGAMALAIWALHLLGAATWSGALLGVLVLAVARERFHARPEQIATVLLLLSVALFESARRSGRDRTGWLVPAQALWANVHATWVFGPILAWFHSVVQGLLEPGGDPRGASEGLGPERAARALRSRWRNWLVLAWVLCVASALVPRPIETLAWAFRFLGEPSTDLLTGSIEELRGWSWPADCLAPFTALLGVALAAALLGGRRAWRASPALCLFALAALTLGALGVRFRGLAAWAAFGPLAVALAPVGRSWRATLGRLAAAAAALAGAAWLAFAPQFPLGIAPLASGIPARATAVADSLGLEGPVLNSFRYGGFLLWARGDAHPPFVDGRVRGSPGLLSLYARASIDPVALDSLVRVWDFTHAIVHPPPRLETTLSVLLARQLDWALIFYDDAGLLFVRRKRTPRLEPLAYRFLTPEPTVMADLVLRSLGDPGLARLLGTELERARRESPYHSRASLWLAQLALAHGDDARAVTLLDEAERLAPATPGLALKQGMARHAVGDLPGARAAFRRALREPDDADDARLELENLK